jgi:hypothetical protein
VGELVAYSGLPSQAFRGATQVTISKLAEVTNVKIAALGREILPYTDLAPEEIEAVVRVFRAGVEHLRKVSPKLAADIARQERLAVEFAAVAKASFPIRGKNYTFPSVPGHLGVAWLFPQAIKYAADVPTDYLPNSWDIPITAGKRAYILGSDTAFYTTSSAIDARSFILIFDNGVVEYGSTPSTQQFRLISDAKNDWGIYTVDPLLEIPLESNIALYQYPTPLGAVFVDYTRGVKWYFMPTRSGVATIKLLGLVYFEHNFASDVKWI